MEEAARLVRGVRRWLAEQDVESVTEFPPSRALRADVAALGPRGEIWIIEVKSGPADFRADAKWSGYRAWCDRFFFAVGAAFPADLIPEDVGLIRADAYGAALARAAPETPLAPARRRALTQRLARAAMRRLRRIDDPGAAALEHEP
ncbi:MAG: MmcB family DNA repair protein [Pseudomonadota bacterium]